MLGWAATLEGARQKDSWLRRSFVTAFTRMRLSLLLVIRPSGSTRDPFQHFNSLPGRVRCLMAGRFGRAFEASPN